MKAIVTLLLLSLSVHTQSPQGPPKIVDPPPKFDEWTRISLADERARLDNLAIHWQQSPHLTIRVVIYAGKTACIGEAEARWTRVRDWLVRKRRIPSNRITWIDGGYHEQSTTTLWLWPPQLGKPPDLEPSLKLTDVKLMKGCKIYSGRAR
jgi:hypothetical protein